MGSTWRMRNAENTSRSASTPQPQRWVRWLNSFLATAPQTNAWDSRVVRVSISATCPPALAALRDNVVMNRPGARRPTLRPKQRWNAR